MTGLRGVRYTVILPKGPQPRQVTSMPQYPSLKDIQAITRPLGIHWLEHYHVNHEGQLCDLVIDEEGKLKGFEPNEWATSVWANGVPPRKTAVAMGELLCGPAVLFHDRVFVDDPNEE